jgi:hypothetical protein
VELLLQILQAIVLSLTGFYVAMLIAEKRHEKGLRQDLPEEERYLDVVPSSLQYGE